MHQCQHNIRRGTGRHGSSAAKRATTTPACHQTACNAWAPVPKLLSSQAATQLPFKGVLPGANYTTNYPAFFNASSLAATISINCFQGESQGAFPESPAFNQTLCAGRHIVAAVGMPKQCCLVAGILFRGLQPDGRHLPPLICALHLPKLTLPMQGSCQG